jgi:hypothetical protein
MVYMQVMTTPDNNWTPGVSLEYETETIALNHIFLSHCGDYHARVTGFFTGVDAWGRTHRMASVEEFLARDTRTYLAKHGLPMPCGHLKPCSCSVSS